MEQKKIVIIQKENKDKDIDATGVEITGFTPEEVIFIFEKIKLSLLENRMLEIGNLDEPIK